MSRLILSPDQAAGAGARRLGRCARLAACSVAVLLVAVAAFHVGVDVGRAEAQPVQPAIDLAQPEGQALIGRVGELSGRMARLESEALALAQRIEALKAFDAHQQAIESTPPRAGEGTRPATPAGGPLIPPVGEQLPAFDGAAFEDHGTGLTALERELQRIDAALASIADATSERDLALMAFPNRMPVAGVEMNSRFGFRADPFNGRGAFHSGVDFAAPSGTPIHASAGGAVVYSGYRADYGYTVEIDHGNGLVTRYAHASKLFVRKGDIVTPGQHIAAVGSTGRSTGPHLHFEVLKDGRYADPAPYLARY